MSDNNTNQSSLADIVPDINCNFFKNQHSIENDINTFKSLITANIFYLRHVIIRSLLRNFDNLSLFHKLLNREFSLFFIQSDFSLLNRDISEIWLNAISHIPSYSFIHSSRRSKRGSGGVGIYIHNICKFIERPNLCIFTDGCFEYIFC